MDILQTFELPQNQVHFTSLPANFQEPKQGEHRIVLLSDNTPVGFFLLNTTAKVLEYSRSPHAVLLTSLSINQIEQGNGYAKKAMLLVKEFVQTEFPDCDEIVLAVNHKNTAAHQLYVKTGFQDTGDRKTGPIGEQLIMKLHF